jgi:N6-adenosine-specific RNA methylase IME4
VRLVTEPPPLSSLDEEFGVIYADPPWSYRHSGRQGGVDHHYETMSIEEIKAMDVPAAEDAYLYLWSTVTHVKEALEVIEAWGFEYKSQAVWDKEQLGIGYWFRGQHELLYVGVRGDVSPPDEEVRRSSVFREERRAHSEKPETVRRYIERAHPEEDKLELFARNGYTGWQVWGDERPERKQTRFTDYVRQERN